MLSEACAPQGGSTWRIRPKLRWSDLAFTLIPTLLWWAAVHSRATFITAHCVERPETCTVASLPLMDQPAAGLEVPGADAMSFTTQGLSGILALSVPPLFHTGLLLTGAINPFAALLGVATDWVILFQVTAWNGVVTESSRLLVQRPRPFVYADPVRARDFSNYTSFYSGHTSFAAASTIGLFLLLAARGAAPWILILMGAVSYSLVSLTGMYRILAGRHFPSDVLTGALMGALVAFAVLSWHRRRTQAPLES